MNGLLETERRQSVFPSMSCVFQVVSRVIILTLIQILLSLQIGRMVGKTAVVA